MRSFKVIVIVGVMCGLAGGVLAADPAQLEADLAVAKTVCEAEPNPTNLAEVERLAALLVAEYGLTPGKARVNVTESEPNDSAATADQLLTGPGGDYGTGDLSPAADIDWWGTSGISPSTLMFAFVATSDSTSGTDSQLNVYDNDGTTLVEFDDDDGPGLSSVVAGALIGPGPAVFHRINEFGDNSEITPYYLFQAVLARTAFGMEVEPNNSPPTATPFTSQGMAGSFSVGAQDFDDWYSVDLLANDILVVILDADPDDMGFAGTKQLEIYDSDGTTLLADEAQDLSRAAYAAGPVTVTADATYYVRVNTDTEAEDYRVVVVINGSTIPVELQAITIE